jgi:hypothetical protein
VARAESKKAVNDEVHHTHSYCLGKVFLALSIAQHAADVEECGILAAARLLQLDAIVEREQNQSPQIELADCAPHPR